LSPQRQRRSAEAAVHQWIEFVATYPHPDRAFVRWQPDIVSKRYAHLLFCRKVHFVPRTTFDTYVKSFPLDIKPHYCDHNVCKKCYKLEQCIAAVYRLSADRTQFAHLQATDAAETQQLLLEEMDDLKRKLKEHSAVSKQCRQAIHDAAHSALRINSSAGLVFPPLHQASTTTAMLVDTFRWCVREPLSAPAETEFVLHIDTATAKHLPIMWKESQPATSKDEIGLTGVCSLADPLWPSGSLHAVPPPVIPPGSATLSSAVAAAEESPVCTTSTTTLRPSSSPASILPTLSAHFSAAPNTHPHSPVSAITASQCQQQCRLF